jgi:nucleotide-binding universal stress UspA family protein
LDQEQIFRNILVPVDGSLLSLNAQELTSFIAKKFNSKVTVLHVVAHDFMSAEIETFMAESQQHVPVSIAGGAGQPPTASHVQRVEDQDVQSLMPQDLQQELTDQLHQRGQAIIDDAVGLFKREGISVNEKIVQHADTAETILNEGEKRNHDLIVMGYHEEEEDGSHLGSVAEKVSRHAKIPVLTARAKTVIRKILVPFDGSKNAQKALTYAVTLAKAANATITLLHVQESSGLSRFRPQMTKEIGSRLLSNATSAIKGIQTNQELESGDPAKVITETANRGGYDIIVMGSRGLGAVGRFLLGSVSDHVNHHANRSVLLMK